MYSLHFRLAEKIKYSVQSNWVFHHDWSCYVAVKCGADDKTGKNFSEAGCECFLTKILHLFTLFTALHKVGNTVLESSGKKAESYKNIETSSRRC
jgi:hypothetical protein